MGWDSSTVSVGGSTKKSEFDRLMNNTIYLRSETATFSGLKTFSDGFHASATSTVDGDLTLGTGAADRIVHFASDANMQWDESEDEFVLDKSLRIGTGQGVLSGMKATSIFSDDSSPTQEGFFDALDAYIPDADTTHYMVVTGGMSLVNATTFVVATIEAVRRLSATTMRIYYHFYKIIVTAGPTLSAITAGVESTDVTEDSGDGIICDGAFGVADKIRIFW